MKKFALIISFFFTFSLCASAQSNKQISVYIPFDFYAQDQKLPAGDYLIESVSRESIQSLLTLIIRDKNGKAKGVITTNSIDLVKDKGSLTPNLVFNRYNKDYFLTTIKNPLENRGFAVRASKLEKLLAKSVGKPTKEMLAVIQK